MRMHCSDIVNNKPINKGLKNTETKMNNPWKLVSLNVQSLLSENSKLNVDYFSEYTKDDIRIPKDMTKT